MKKRRKSNEPQAVGYSHTTKETANHRVMYSITDWIERKLGLKVNADKTHITRPMKLKYLGFGWIPYRNSKGR